MPRAELYIGNLNRDVNKKDIESVFEKYGRLVRCDVKNKGYGSVYAFLEFDEERDAEVSLIFYLFKPI
jgi:RNA recognition motif-containing protein